MEGKTTFSTSSARRHPGIDRKLLQTLPDELKEIQIDPVLLLQACGAWSLLTRAHQDRVRRMQLRLVARVDHERRTVDSYLTLPQCAASAKNSRRTGSKSRARAALPVVS